MNNGAEGEGIMFSKTSYQQVTKMKKPPRKIPTTIDLVVEGAGAPQIGAAQLQLLKAETALKTSRKYAVKAQKKKMKALEEQHKKLLEIYHMEFDNHTCERTIEASREGLKALRKFI